VHKGLRCWHKQQSREAITTHTLTGRQVLNVLAFTEKLNTPVQGSGAGGSCGYWLPACRTRTRPGTWTTSTA
jgi:hypothetical protein